MQRKKHSHYQSLIAEATGAPDHLLPLLETLMREEVFHSTLDWQSARQLADGAMQAYDLYRSAPAYYDKDMVLQKSRFQLARIEESLAKAKGTGNQAKIADLAAAMSA